MKNPKKLKLAGKEKQDLSAAAELLDQSGDAEILPFPRLPIRKQTPAISGNCGVE
jgi:hypothetical protein